LTKQLPLREQGRQENVIVESRGSTKKDRAPGDREHASEVGRTRRSGFNAGPEKGDRDVVTERLQYRQGRTESRGARVRPSNPGG